MKRYDKFVIDAEKGITFELSEGTSGELIIKAHKIPTSNVHFEKHVSPPIMEGYKYVCGKWKDGFVIKRRFDGSEFIWIPVGYLDSNGTLDGNSFTEKFGRRNYRNHEFSESAFHETLTDELALQIESVEKYGGFYISRYKISINEKGELQSLKGFHPRTHATFNDIKKMASTMEDNEIVKSHLTFGAEFDSVLEWVIKSKARTRNEIVEDCTNWGIPKKFAFRTGSGHCTNHIYDFGGMSEWTQEQYSNSSRVIRDSSTNPVSNRTFCNPACDYFFTGFRVALCIK